MIRRRVFLTATTVALLGAYGRLHAQTAIPRIGWLAPRIGESSFQFKAFVQGLREGGYVEGQNATVKAGVPSHPERMDQFPALARQLANGGVAVVVAINPFAIEAAIAATKTIPIVGLDLETDPVARGWVATLARPGGNLTGLFLDIPEMTGKLLQFLREARPDLRRVGVLGDPQVNSVQFRVAEAAARTAGVALQSFVIQRVDDIPIVIADAARAQAGALLVLSSPLVLTGIARVADAALKSALPTICPFVPTFAEAGGLLAYGPDFPDLFRRAGGYAAKVLQGAHPRDLPVQRPEKFELAVNLKTARALKLTLPPSLVGRADRVIE